MSREQNLSLPVLIYISKQNCPGCLFYNNEWEKVKQQLNGRARFVKFTCYPGPSSDPNSKNIPPPLAKYGTWFPSIILAGPKSYFKCFTPDDQINTDEYSNDYIIKAKKFNAVETNDEYEFAGRPNNADQTVMWFNQIVNSVSEYDDVTPPKKYMYQLQN